MSLLTEGGADTDIAHMEEMGDADMESEGPLDASDLGADQMDVWVTWEEALELYGDYSDAYKVCQEAVANEAFHNENDVLTYCVPIPVTVEVGRAGANG